ncbi:MAG: hypothetical protein ABSG98_08795 [Anaerolineales bacterium]|jgi:hypothetical protein
MTSAAFPPLDRSVFSVVSLHDRSDDLEFWLVRSHEDRLGAIEVSRRMVYGYDWSSARLQRVLEIAPFPRG